MRKRVQLLKSHLRKKFDAGFYLSRRSNFIHVGLDVLLFSTKNYQDFIDEINKALSKESGARLSRKIKKKENMNSMNSYVPKFRPKDLPWYERDGLMTWYDQMKCEDIF